MMFKNEGFGNPAGFPTTAWTTLLGAHTDDTVARTAAWTSLAQNYWKAIYGHIRIRWKKPPEDATDLTQEFFLWMMESDFVRRADPGRGRFRALLKVSLNNFLGGLHRENRSLKRGGGRKPLRLDIAPREIEEQISTLAGRDPDETLDEIWRNEILTQASVRLKENLEQEGRSVHYRLFHDFYLSGEDDVDYATLVRRYGLSETDVGHHLQFAKARFREELIRQVTETVSNPIELEEELNALFGGLSS